MATPSLAMIPSGYKSGKVYSVLPTDGTGDLTFTRASSATRVNQSGLIELVATGVPRLDYTGGGCPSLLLEPQSTNLLTYSEAFDNAYWNKSLSSIVLNSLTSPSGLVDASKLIEDSSNSDHRIFNGTGLTLSGTVSFSVFIKKGERNFIKLTNNNLTGVYFDLNNGVIGTIDSGFTAKIENYSNGWYKCSMSATAAANERFIVYTSVDGITTTYQGDGTSGIYIYGAQLEQQSYATSYIPTSGPTVTRIEDTASKTGLSNYIDSTSGVFEVNISALSNNQTFRSISISNGTTSNTIIIRYSDITQQIQFLVIIGGVIVYFHGETVADITVSTKCKLKWDLANFGAKINDVEVDSQLSGAVFAANTLTKVGFTEGTTTFKFEGNVGNLKVYKGITSY